MLDKKVKVTVDRPLGTYHPQHKNLYYPINYGYIEGIMALAGAKRVVGIDLSEKMIEEAKATNNADNITFK